MKKIEISNVKKRCNKWAIRDEIVGENALFNLLFIHNDKWKDVLGTGVFTALSVTTLTWDRLVSLRLSISQPTLLFLSIVASTVLVFLGFGLYSARRVVSGVQKMEPEEFAKRCGKVRYDSETEPSTFRGMIYSYLVQSRVELIQTLDPHASISYETDVLRVRYMPRWGEVKEEKFKVHKKVKREDILEPRLEFDTYGIYLFEPAD